ncbi:MAG: META domain-containing protein [bacterium]|nr:META domain-containing protein [bacterium]
MNKKLVYVIAGVIVLIGLFYFMTGYIYKEKQTEMALDYKNAEYVIDGKRVKLVNGVSEIEAAPGSASKIVTRYFGNEVRKDLNDDGKEDIVFLLTQEMGGSGAFFYVAAALNTDQGYIGSEALLLGDRIAPQTTESEKGKVVAVNYADRAPGESFATRPSIGKSIWLLLNPETMQLGEVEQNFEGEADPSKMTLGMTTWNWIKALYNDGREITPKQSGKFTLSFSSNGLFSVTTDCNSMSGSYTADKNNISFGSMASTKMHCEGSQEAEFASLLTDARNYHFTSRGELVLDLKFDSGSVVFR